MSESALNIENHAELVNYLRDRRIIAPDAMPALENLTGGVSNRTVLVECKGSSAFVIKQALSKLRVEAEWFSDPARIHREARGLEWLEKLAPAGTITPLMFEDRVEHLIGMVAVPRPHDNWKQALIRGEINLGYVEQFADLLGMIHRESLKHSDVLASVFSDRSFFETLRIEPYYRYSAQRIPGSKRFFGELIEETFATRLTIVHGDFSPKNILVHDGRLILLDHEVIHFGDPAFDVGFSLTHLLSKAHHVASQRTAFLECARLYAARYLECLHDFQWRHHVEQRAVRHTIGCLLARVAGRSPLEYLTEQERARQQNVAVCLMQNPPVRLSCLIDTFSRELACRQ